MPIQHVSNQAVYAWQIELYECQLFNFFKVECICIPQLKVKRELFLSHFSKIREKINYVQTPEHIMSIWTDLKKKALSLIPATKTTKNYFYSSHSMHLPWSSIYHPQKSWHQIRHQVWTFPKSSCLMTWDISSFFLFDRNSNMVSTFNESHVSHSVFSFYAYLIQYTRI